MSHVRAIRILAAAALLLAAAPAAAQRTCTVERIIDGDTLVCAESPIRVRLLLIDTPEMSQGEFGRAAREALLRLVPVGTVTRLELDIRELDRYGRILAYLYTADGRLANEEMARAGFAVPLVYPPNVRYVERIRAAAQEAREARRGLWSGTAFDCAPVDHRSGRCR